ncbi:Short-chain dehydrogenase [Flexibacter flexilis DSM 6793]|uniref:Short-chain dehydrogenase n=1 Tax=Flexibacter flexilis DSM 6793 TaxID=927664 RepID=A0A1I1MCQ4_9BACT|nr:SDR family oxidoreductase [Flexibacter flexilis]SFC83181.1 Short-chain dehydrogenase [Flexibacter flexilis DSM 6793]
MSTIKGQKVLITGGGSGIGKLMGELVLRKGATQLVIWDISPANIETTLKELQPFGNVTAYQVDISDLTQIQNAAEKVKKEIGKIDILINNAGIIVGKLFHEHSTEEITRTMNINANAPMYITQQFLSDMLAQNRGHICNIASSAGLISNPKMSVYVSSKWAILGWSDSLRIEMQQQKLNVHVTTVTPYYISTGMFDGVRSIVPILKPEKVAKKVIEGIEKNKIFVSMPWSVRFVRFGQALMPIWLFDWFIGDVMGIYKTMQHFKGRK